jgi:hypothetical protein
MGQVRIAYLPPNTPTHQALYDFLKENRALEELQKLLNPYRLPRTLTIRMEECGGEDNAWYEDDAVTVCYEYMDHIWANAPVLGPLSEFARATCSARR